MIDEIFVIDDVINKNYQDSIEKTLLSNTFPWFFHKDITYNQIDEINNYGFGHTMVNEDGQIISNYYNFLLPLIFSAFDKVNLKLENVLKCRTFLQLPRPNKNPHNIPHVDLSFNHLVFLYYVNDSDGDTIIFKEKCDKNIVFDKDYKFNVFKKISPKKGRGLIFNGNTYHASSNPTNNPRCVINFDIR
jgi:hypothetical protein